MTWFYEHDGEPRGPLSADDIRELAQRGQVRPATPVWREGMLAWSPACEHFELEGLAAIPPPLAPSKHVHPARVENNLVKAALTTMFCFMPLGIVSIVYAMQVDRRAREGDTEGALDYADKADRWANAAIVVGATLGAIGLFLALLMGSHFAAFYSGLP